MFEKVNPSHPDKIADRIAGALVDYAYATSESTFYTSPKIAVEVLIGHGTCTIISETSVHIPNEIVASIVTRITGQNPTIVYLENKQDKHLAQNQQGIVKCGDNGIFKGTPLTAEQETLTEIAKLIYEKYPYDGKYLIHNRYLTICQSHADTDTLRLMLPPGTLVNPLGYWEGGTDVDTGATNRKLGSDMGDGVTGGGLHGKDLSKADVTLNICAFLDAQEKREPVEYCCSIGDTYVNNIPYTDYVTRARKYIDELGGFEKFAEWGLVV